MRFCWLPIMPPVTAPTPPPMRAPAVVFPSWLPTTPPTRAPPAPPARAPLVVSQLTLRSETAPSTDRARTLGSVCIIGGDHTPRRRGPSIHSIPGAKFRFHAFTEQLRPG